MRSSSCDDNRHTSSSSSSSSRLSTPRRAVAMEEVWKDISLASLQDRSGRREEGVSPKGGVRRTMLQEFLARPFKEQSGGVGDRPDMEMSTFGGPLTPLPVTVLSLNSSPEFQYLDSINPLRLHPQNCFMGASSPKNSPFDAIGSSFCKKRTPEGLDSSGDRRNKRMIKNRESAARSRARKQAYTNELELEVAHLMEENGRLRKQQQQLLMAAASPAPTKSRLYRTSSAPF